MGERQRLPCGCVIDNIGDAFVMEPCAADCEYFLYAVEESKRQGKPLTSLADPEADPGAVSAVARLLRQAGIDTEDKP